MITRTTRIFYFMTNFFLKSFSKNPERILKTHFLDVLKILIELELLEIFTLTT